MHTPRRYGVAEIFYSLQGEGYWTGTPMLFLRMTGCNLRCPWCDTDFSHGQAMDIRQIVEGLRSALLPSCPAGDLRGMRVCITGGEPSLQVDAPLVDALHAEDLVLHMETNGTHGPVPGIDWTTLSPKDQWCGEAARVVLDRADEVKLVYTSQPCEDIERWGRFEARWHFLQPCSCSNTEEVVEYIQSHPRWRLSLQTHKYLGVR